MFLEKDNKIENPIYKIRGVQVILDSDLAILYECVNGTKTINQAVKSHVNKFPERYMFKLNKIEYEMICGPKLGPQVAKSRTLPYVFTEQGVAMLSSVLNEEIFIQELLKILNDVL